MNVQWAKTLLQEQAKPFVRLPLSMHNSIHYSYDHNSIGMEKLFSLFKFRIQIFKVFLAISYSYIRIETPAFYGSLHYIKCILEGIHFCLTLQYVNVQESKRGDNIG